MGQDGPFKTSKQVKELLGYLANGGSDHGRQYYSIGSKQFKQPVKVMTWNMLNKCFSVTDKLPFSNNPWNISESVGNYAIRLNSQLEKILDDIRNNRADIITLQEIDWFNDAWSNATITKIRDNFKEALEEEGW